ncbi:carbon storage regulator [Pseudarthrobacter sp. AB1]|uniref:carbon storage regulator n=1 Tax=Pseudarthrobacter sp. AB1 TaxID=2138309 RepID=UPI00186B948B|nr:carbon storage regulator [Pseudarthrobacter sp. AB1]MBE4720493.1 carbon storage regulator [Pseudarthrobacter sp. AB1]
MLVLTRKPGQTLRIGEDIIIKIVEVRGEGIRIGIEAPKDVSIQRGEVAEALAAATIEVANDGYDGDALQSAALRLLVTG